MDNSTVNAASVDQAARALIFELASAVAADFDTARSLGYPDLMRTVTEFVIRSSLACEKGAAGPQKGEGELNGSRPNSRSVIPMGLDWIRVSEPYDQADGALMPGLMVKHGAITRIGDGEVFVAMWPSVPPEHIDDFVTLTLTVDDEVIQEIGRYASYDAAKAAAQEYVKGLGEQRPGTR